MPRFAARGSDRDIEAGTTFMPRFDEHGLIACIVADASDGAVLTFAYMNEEALARTIDTGEAWFWSRSRRALWHKGETSGNTFAVEEMRVDCDQDAVLMRVRVAGDGVACHTGARSCFYRRLPLRQKSGPAQLTFIEKEKGPPRSGHG
jgi:phosphoribosyl-AMP cyclohydrolase